MALFWSRMKQAQLRALSNQFKRCYFQIHGSSSVIRETRIGVGNSPSLAFHKTGSELGNYVRFFAAPVQVKPKYEEKDKGRPRMNEQISAQYVRLVTDEGHGVVSRREALEHARRLDVDLVEVQADGDPPVCKLMDYNKEMYIRQAKEKEQTKRKSDLVLRRGALKEVRITCKIDKNDLQTKADTVKRLTERGHRVKCMAVGTADQDLGGLLSRLSVLIDDFSLVESGPSVEAKQAYIVVRHVKFGPLKKGPGKKKILAPPDGNTAIQSSEKLGQSLDESDLETEEDTFSKEAVESDSPDNFDVMKNETRDHMRKFAPETSNWDRTGSENRYAPTRQMNASATGSENRYAATRQTNGSAPGSENRYATTRQTNVPAPGVRRRLEPESQYPGSNRQFDLNRRGPSREPKLVDTEAASSPASTYGMFSTPKPNTDPRRDGPQVEVNRYKNGPNSKPPPSDYHTRGAHGDFSRENSNTNPRGIWEKQAGSRR